MISSLRIVNFRAFRDLTIERLGRVNLIAGKNNVGKSTILEALELYADPRLRTILRLVSRRTDGLALISYMTGLNLRNGSIATGGDVDRRVEGLQYLFNGRPLLNLASSSATFKIQLDSESLTVRFQWATQSDNSLNGKHDRNQTDEPLHPYLYVDANDEVGRYRLDIEYPSEPLTAIPTRPTLLVPVNGLRDEQVTVLWRTAVMAGREDQIVEALRIIEPTLERLNIVDDGNTPFITTPMVRLSGIKEAMPLRNFGDGMQRMFGIALALVNCQNGVLLIDEAENGFHYIAQYGLWEFIFQVASQINVQVFATTHSRDCIAAFQHAAMEDTANEGMLFRLDKIKDEIYVATYDERKLQVAVEQAIETR